MLSKTVLCKALTNEAEIFYSLGHFMQGEQQGVGGDLSCSFHYAAKQERNPSDAPHTSSLDNLAIFTQCTATAPRRQCALRYYYHKCAMDIRGKYNCSLYN